MHPPAQQQQQQDIVPSTTKVQPVASGLNHSKGGAFHPYCPPSQQQSSVVQSVDANKQMDVVDKKNIVDASKAAEETTDGPGMETKVDRKNDEESDKSEVDSIAADINVRNDGEDTNAVVQTEAKNVAGVSNEFEATTSSTATKKEREDVDDSVDKEVLEFTSATTEPAMMDKSKLAPVSTAGNAMKRPREGDVTVDDVTPKATSYNHGTFNFPGSAPPVVHRGTSNGHPVPYQMQNKRSRLSDLAGRDQYDPATMSHGNIKYKEPYYERRDTGRYPPHSLQQPPQHASQIKAIQPPAHRRSFSLESLEEARQDKSHGRHDRSGGGDYGEERYESRHVRQSYSPTSSLASRRTLEELYQRRDRAYSEDSKKKDDERRIGSSFSQSNSWAECPEPGASLLNTQQSMSWELPPGLSGVGSFSQLKSEVMSSPGNSLTQRREDNRDDLMDANLPPLPTGEDNGSLPPRKRGYIAPRPHNNRMYDHRDLYAHPPPPPPRFALHHAHDRSSVRYPAGRYYPEDRHYANDHMHRKEYGDPRAQRFDHPMRDGRDDRRDPYDSRGYNPRYEHEDTRHRHHSPPPQRESFFPYPNDTPGGLSAGSRSFDSRSLGGDMEEPMNSLLYRPSFSWERGLDVQPHDEQVNSSRMFQLRDQQRIMKSLAMRGEIRTIGDPNSHIGLILLLAMPQDRHFLSETLCIVRNNVEVFTATEADVSAPAPGRKKPVQVGQVGIRCVYCRMCNSGRVKRATCFPASLKRVYRAVIDMKLDHFKCCPYVPPGLKARLDELSETSTRSTGLTVQYFVRSAKELGMYDVDDGICIDLKQVGTTSGEGFNPYQGVAPQKTVPKSKGRVVPQSARSSASKAQFKAKEDEELPPLDPNAKRYEGQCLLSLPEDINFLSPLRCFLRQNVCAFTASEKDIAIRTPTTFSVRVGQVGVGCVHCLSVEPKMRSNRAVCFPFTSARIYQSVADIQRFHLGECRMMPPDVRAEFLRLQSESAKGSRGLATRNYWIDSAKKIGLADSLAGMYFSRDPSLPPQPDAESLDVLAQVATKAKLSSKPLVTPEDKPNIAEFLYVVMEQLQACRFTDADRNKRRSKNLGSIGVECKNCAGKIDGRKFFWSSVSAAESNFVSVHSHMMECKYISNDLKTELARLKALRREQTSRLKTGSQKAFFTRVWDRLHAVEKDSEATPSAITSSSVTIKLVERKPNENEVSFELQAGGSSDEIRALLESKSSLSSTEELTNNPTESTENLDTEFKTVVSSEMSNMVQNLSTVSVRSKEEKKLTSVAEV